MSACRLELCSFVFVSLLTAHCALSRLDWETYPGSWTSQPKRKGRWGYREPAEADKVRMLMRACCVHWCKRLLSPFMFELHSISWVIRSSPTSC
jgi:hypothetical protein